MAPDDFEWGGGEVVYWALGGLDPTRPLHEQLDEFKEDLVQVRFSSNTLLDVGWYPEFSGAGAFVVTVVRDEDWDEPLYSQEGTSISALRLAIAEGVRVATG